MHTSTATEAELQNRISSFLSKKIHLMERL